MPGTRTSSAPELLVRLDRNASEPMHRQLERGLRDAVRSRRLRAGAALPSSRVLARELGVSRGLVVEVYEQLVAEGYLASRPGGKTRVARAAAISGGVRSPTGPVTFEVDFRPGRPDLQLFPREAWLRSIRRALGGAPAARLNYGDGRGMPELRLELARYLNRVRGTAADPDDIVVTNGFAQGLWLLGRVLADRGSRGFAIEDPALGDSREIIGSVGLRLHEIPVDGDGLVVDRLEQIRVGGVLVTPAHQYPTGAVLSPARRSALLAWADHRNAVVLEDDYDAEFRYDRQPIGAMQGLRPDRVVYAGSASKVLAPALRLGWFVAPPALAGEMAATRKAIDQGGPATDQLAFADFLGRGELDRHLRRMRPVYRARRDALLEAISRHLPDAQPVGAAAGLHILAWLPGDRDPVEIVAAAEANGIGLGFVARGSGREGGGLVFGYGSIRESEIEAGIRRLAPVMATSRAGA